MTYDELVGLARRLEGRTLETVTGKKFRVGIFLDCPFFTPESSGRGQSDGRMAAERFVERYNQIGSLHPGHYAKVTRNASYFIGLLLAADPSLRPPEGMRSSQPDRNLRDPGAVPTQPASRS